MIRSLIHRPHPLRSTATFARSSGVVVAALAFVGVIACGAGTSGAKSGTTSNAVSPAAPSRGMEGGVEAVAPATGVTAQDSGAGAFSSVDASRTVIRTGAMDLVVRSVAGALESARQVATAANGTVSDSSFTGSGGQQSAQLTLRVPADRFADVIARLQDLAAEVRSVTTASRDVTGEVTDVEATLRNLRAVEAQYVQLLGRAGSIGDVLQVQDRLNQVRLQIDRTEARRQYLASQSEMATLTVSLRSAASAGTGLPSSARAAWSASLRTIEAIATATLVVIVYSWWLVPVAIVVAWFVVRRVRRGRGAASVKSIAGDLDHAE